MKLTQAQYRDLTRFPTHGRLKHDPKRRKEKAAEAAKQENQGRDQLFDAMCTAHGLPLPVHEYEWGMEAPLSPKGKPRKWRFDWLFEGWLAVEQVGGIWKGGHHSGGKNQLDDMKRRNEALILDYHIMEFTPQQIESGEAFETIRRALNSR